MTLNRIWKIARIMTKLAIRLKVFFDPQLIVNFLVSDDATATVLVPLNLL